MKTYIIKIELPEGSDDGGDAYEAYLDDQERLVLTQCSACAGEGHFHNRITVYEPGCAFPHDDVEEIRCEACGGEGTVQSAARFTAQTFACPHKDCPKPVLCSESCADINLHRCPTCNSPSPELHPAVQLGGEVQPCTDSWHSVEH